MGRGVGWGVAACSAVCLPPLTLDPLSRFAGRGNGERLVDEFRDGEAVGQFQSLLERIRETRTEIFPDDDPVDDDVDVMLEFFVELRRIANVIYCAVDLEALVALLLPLGDFLAVLAFAAAHDGRQDQKTRALGQRKHTIDHLRNGLAFDRQAGGRANRGHRRGRTADAGSRRFPSPCRRSSAGSCSSSSARSRSPATARRCDRRPASASSRGTGARRPTGSRRSGAGPRRRSCRRLVTIFPNPKAR